jgi:glycosyltransferase involved in cell wall biosynthesis
MKKKKLLIMTDSYCVYTGFANVGRHVADHLHSTGKYEIAYLCWFHAPMNNIKPPFTVYTTMRDHSRCCGRGPVVMKQEVDKPIQYLKHHQGVLIPLGDGPQCLGGPNMDHDKYAYESLHGTILDFQPDIVWSVSDCWMQFHTNMMDIRECFKYYSYFPIDGSPMPHIVEMGNQAINWIDAINKADRSYAFCNFGRDAMIKTGSLYGTDLNKVGVIYHGSDNVTFRPLENKAELKKKHFKLDDKTFLVGCFSRNQPRKAFHKLFEALALGVKKGYWTGETIKCYFHCPVRDVGWYLPDLIKTHGLENIVLLNDKLQVGQGPTDAEMNELYNALDLMTLPSRGEGWGLTYSEAMSAGVPVLMSAYSAHHDWAEKAAARIKVAALDSEPLTNIDRAIVDVDDYCEKLKAFKDNISLEEFETKFGPVQSYKDEKESN